MYKKIGSAENITYPFITLYLNPQKEFIVSNGLANTKFWRYEKAKEFFNSVTTTN